MRIQVFYVDWMEGTCMERCELGGWGVERAWDLLSKLSKCEKKIWVSLDIRNS